MTWLVFVSALWLGILTAISPCPLASNIAAISFVGRQVGDKPKVLLAGLLYTVGRTVAYVVLGVIITAGLFASGDVSRFLQRYMNEALGPILILLGMTLLGMFGASLSFNAVNEKVQSKAEKSGTWFAFPLGVLFALSFCPISAGLFFAGLLPLCVKSSSSVILPLVYGVGTALPVVFFAFLIAFGGEYLGKAFNCLQRVELWIRRIAGVLLVLAGVYYTLVYIYELKIY